MLYLVETKNSPGKTKSTFTRCITILKLQSDLVNGNPRTGPTYLFEQEHLAAWLNGFQQVRHEECDGNTMRLYTSHENLCGIREQNLDFIPFDGLPET